MMEYFRKKSIFVKKTSIIDVFQGPKYAFELFFSVFNIVKNI